MNTVGPNDPCPCGSGKKYRYCCGATNIIPFPTPTDAPLYQFPDLGNRPQDEPPEGFLGLSEDQMEDVLWSSFDEWNDIVVINPEVSARDVELIPILRSSLGLLRRIREIEPLAATKKGNLPQKIVREMYERFRQPGLPADFRFRSETDWRPLHSLRVLLVMADLLKKTNNQFSLTQTASRLVDREDYGVLYSQLMGTHITEYNWGFGDSHSELPLLQQLALFGLFLLRAEGAQGVSADHLGDMLLQVVPYAVEQCEPGSYHTPEEEVKTTFRTRFLDRFAFSFGLVTTDQGESWLTGNDTIYKTTDLFQKYLSWRI